MPSKMSWNLLKVRHVVLLSLFVAGATTAPAQQVPRISHLAGGASYREDRILIIPKAGRRIDLDRLHGRMGARLRKKFPALGNIEVLDVPPGMSAQGLVTLYRQSGLVEAADLNIMFKACSLPNDPRTVNGDQWHLNNFGQSFGLFDADIDAPEAWDISNSASNIVVAIIDSGIRLTHQDLLANLWVNPGEIPGNNIDDDGNGVVDDIHGINTVPVTPNGVPTDDFGHGTHVAGILGAVGNNGLGVSGVAWNVKLMACKFLDGSGNGFLDDLIGSLNYAKTNGARIVNCSFETPGPMNTVLSNAFWGLRSAGILVVAASGNSGTDIDVSPRYPASFALDNIISVMASTRSDTYGGYNYGATSVDLAAPGFEILSTYRRSDSDYFSQSGTSMAAPCVAAAAALV
ncbi:MAG: S8 family peptidase, partial [Planctomycetota bacterium]|nr:S8 family peptidase [Planctomycetota bacterium]